MPNGAKCQPAPNARRRQIPKGASKAVVRNSRYRYLACIAAITTWPPQGRPDMSTMNQPEVLVTVTTAASTEVKKFMEQENVDPGKGGLRISVQPGGCSGFKYGLLIEDEAAEDDL